MTIRKPLHRSTTTFAACALLTAFWLAPVDPVLAQSDCVPVAGGVPALGGPPNWYDDVGEPDYWPRLDDPRWRGSFLRTFGGMVGSEHLLFRALRHGAPGAEALYLSWSVIADPELNNNADSLFVAFSPGDGAQDVLINVEPFAFHDSDLEAEDPFSAVHTLRDAMTNQFDLGNPDPSPPWFDDIKIWLETVGRTWAVQMRIPIAPDPAGIDFQSSFKMWFTVQMVHPDGVVFYDYPDLAYWEARSDPDPLSRLLTLDGVTNGTDTTNWAELRRDVPPSDPGCLQGISLVASDVGVVESEDDCDDADFTLSSNIDLIDGGSPATNTFCARPHNGTGGLVMAGDVSARFRIANWGTEADWNQVTNPLDSLWTEVDCTPAVAIGPDIGAGGNGSLTCDWTLSLADVCSFDPAFPGCPAGSVASRRTHQCMLVELDAAAGTALSVSSVYRNMNFVDASVFRRDCTVATVPGQERDVFLYVQTTNIPSRVTRQPPAEPRPDRPAPTPPQGGDDDVIIEGETPNGDGTPGEIPPLEQPFYGELRSTMPTYVVHAYHDTGTTAVVAGSQRRVLRPQTSFGYFVRHQGDLEGWRHSLTGAQEIAPDYYQISVPDGGTRMVTTTIEAIERGPWSLSLHAGVNEAGGALPDAGLSAGLDVEYALGGALAVELYFGYDEFDADGATPGVEIKHLAADLRWYFTSGGVRPFVLGGLGYYDPDDASGELGGLLGGGVQWPLSPDVGLEVEARYHDLFGGPDYRWLAVHAGLRFHL